MKNAMPANVLEAEIARIPVGRIWTPADIASSGAFLVSDEAAFITGQVISVDGGQLMV
jgi:acetoacetyl-CoA reductase